MSDHASLIGILKTVEPFASLDIGELTTIANHFREMHLKVGEPLFRRGDQGNELYVVAEGQLRLSVATEKHRELTVRMATRGELIGELSTLDHRPRTADALALTPVRLYVLAGADLDRLLDTLGSLTRGIIRFLCRRVRDTTDQLESIALYPLEVRLARFLLIALGKKSAPSDRRIPLELGFSQSELAQLLAASRPKVNMALGTLEANGAIKRTSDRLFCDPALLARIAELDQ